MTKIPKSPTKIAKAELADAVLYEALGMPTDEMVRRRAARLTSMYSATALDRVMLCYGESPCGRASCIACRQGGQRSSMVTAMHHFKELGDDVTLHAGTIIPAFGKTAVGELPKGGLRGLRNQSAARVRSVAPEARMIGCVDVSVERRLGEPESWQWHPHVVAWNMTPEEMEELNTRFAWPKKAGESSTCYRPVRFEKITNLSGYLAYMYKPQFFLREQYADASGQLRFRKRMITLEQELMFIKALAPYKASQRFFDIGVKRT